MPQKSEVQDNSEGIIRINSRGKGFFAHPRFPEDLEILTKDLHTALDGDTVEVLVYPKIYAQRRRAKVFKVLKRSKTKFVGTVIDDNGLWVKSDDYRIHVLFKLTDGEETAPIGHKVHIKMQPWTSTRKVPVAQIINDFGLAGENEAEMRSIVASSGFAIDFPLSVITEVKQFKTPLNITQTEMKDRRDFRNTVTLTIDPKNAKDFDDALSIKTLDNGNFEIGIHIADVSHYVKPKTAIDVEAVKRGVSVYLVDRTVPMLPEVLSNDLCSLKPNVDRLAFSAVFEVSANGEVRASWFGETIIHSNRRFTYEDAQGVINGGVQIFANELKTLNTIAKKLAEKNRKNGAIDFATDEVGMELDEGGAPIRVFKKEHLDTHSLVEQFMLLANREVAKRAHRFTREKMFKQAAMMYRIHDAPNIEKIEELNIFLRASGHEIPINQKFVSQHDINALLERVKGDALEALIKQATLRSMAKAIYSIINKGHYGLAFEYYTHFTSPIRRYPDLLVHRLFKKFLKKEKIPSTDINFYRSVAMSSTEREIEAMEAERTSLKMKQTEYMAKRVGEVFDGAITGVTEWGMYVEEATSGADGLVALRAMKDDFYTLDKKNYCIQGERTKKKYALGDKIRVKLIKADVKAKIIDFEIVQRV